MAGDHTLRRRRHRCLGQHHQWLHRREHVTSGVAFGATESQLSLAWALYAGLGYQVTPSLTIEAAYRYLNLGKAHSGDLIAYDGTNTIDNPMEFRHLTSQDFKLGFRWAFDTPSQQQSYYPPVVKY